MPRKKGIPQRTNLLTLAGLKDLEEPGDFYQRVWKGMPEFTRESTMPIQRIVVSFATREDVKRFEDVVGQRLTDSTNSIWFPYKGLENMKGGLVYKDEEDKREITGDWDAVYAKEEAQGVIVTSTVPSVPKPPDTRRPATRSRIQRLRETAP